MAVTRSKQDVYQPKTTGGAQMFAQHQLFKAAQEVPSVEQASMNAKTFDRLSMAKEEAQKMLQTGLTQADQDELHFNLLIILDDVIAEIKKQEFDTRQTSLIFNRRHKIINGTVSIILVAQKYSMIPGRLRSNANWVELFKLNPNDFGFVYKDIINLNQETWKALLKYSFGDVDQPIEQSKKYSHLGILVNEDRYFLNFGEIEFGCKERKKEEEEEFEEEEEEEKETKEEPTTNCAN